MSKASWFILSTSSVLAGGLGLQISHVAGVFLFFLGLSPVVCIVGPCWPVLNAVSQLGVLLTGIGLTAQDSTLQMFML
jgi:hypothetical protein